MGVVNVELRTCLLAASLCSAGLGHHLLLSFEEPYRSDLKPARSSSENKAPSRALAPTVARRQSGIDSPDGQSIRPSSLIQFSADWRACSAPNNGSTARMKP